MFGLRLVFLSKRHTAVLEHLRHLISCRGLLAVRVSIVWFTIVAALVLFLRALCATRTPTFFEDGIKCVMAHLKDRVASVLCEMVTLQNGHVQLRNLPFKVSGTIIRQQLVLL